MVGRQSCLTKIDRAVEIIVRKYLSLQHISVMGKQGLWSESPSTRL